MNIVACVIAGGILGWWASIALGIEAQQGIVGNIAVGILGAFLGGFVIAPLLGIEIVAAANFSVTELAASFVGAVLSLTAVNALRRR